MRMERRSDIQANGSGEVEALRAQIAEMRARMGVIARDNASLARDNRALACDNEALARELSESNQTIADLKSRLDEQQVEIARLLEQVRLANCRFFGSKSERVVPEQLSLFNDMDSSADESAAEPKLEEAIGAAAGKGPSDPQAGREAQARSFQHGDRRYRPRAGG